MPGYRTSPINGTPAREQLAAAGVFAASDSSACARYSTLKRHGDDRNTKQDGDAKYGDNRSPKNNSELQLLLVND